MVTESGLRFARAKHTSSAKRAVPHRPSLIARHPAALPIVASLAAWSTVVLTHRTGASSGLSHRHLPDTASAGLDVVAAMTVAMMAPLCLTAVGHVARGSAVWRIGRSVVLFFGTFISCWVVTALALNAAVRAAVHMIAPAALASGCLFAAALFQVTPYRGKLSVLCHWPMRLRVDGEAADADCVRFGTVAATRCVQTCALPMAACLALPHELALMAALSAIALIERGYERPRHFALAVSYLSLALLLLS